MATLSKSKSEKEVILYSDAHAIHGRFAITDQDGRPVWYGRFFQNDFDYCGDQLSGELSAAKKAVWVGGQIQRILDRPIKLKLCVAAKWLGKSRELMRSAEKNGILLEVVFAPGKGNTVGPCTFERGYQKWTESELCASLTGSVSQGCAS